MLGRWWLMTRLRLRALLCRDAVDRELDEELRDHFERRVEAELAGGTSPDRARRAALRAMDGLLQQKERSRDMRGLTFVDHTLQDLRYGLRSLRRHPGFTAATVLTIALGIGANTIVFSVVDGLILSPFPYPQPDRLVGIGSEYPRLGVSLGFWENLSPAEYRDVTTRSRLLEHVVAWDMGNRQIAEMGLENVFSAFWWGDAFRTLQVAPAVGRGFLPEEIARGDRVAILSHRVWQSRFAGDPALVGSQIHVNAEPYTVVGVMPPRTLIYATDLWLPMPVTPDAYSRQRRQFQALARLAPGATLEQANLELESIARGVSREHGQEFREYEDWRLAAMTWQDVNVRTIRPAALLLLGATGFVLLMVCANLANVLLARFATRGREMALRASLGAGRGRLARQLLVESLLLAVGGGALGLLIALPAVQGAAVLLAQAPVVSLPGEIGINVRVMLATLGVSIAFAFLVGAAPAARAFRTHPQDLLKGSGATAAASPGRLRFQRTLVGVQIALAVLLLTGGGLLVHSLARLQRVPAGFATDHLLTLRLTLPAARYPADSRGVFFRELVRRLEGVSGVQQAAATTQFPPNAFSRAQLVIEGEAPVSEDTLPAALFTTVSPGYFDTLGVQLLSGREFDGDRAEGPQVAIINDVAAQRFFGGQDAVGRRFRTRAESAWIEVIGVVRATRNRGLEVPAEPELFVPLDQRLSASNQLYMVVRTTPEPRAVLPAVRAEVRAMDPEQPIYAIRTVDEMFALESGPRRVAALALAVFAVFALLLAAVGVYGVVSYSVAQRTQEIGLRMALGASHGGIRSLVMRQASVPVAGGLVIGLAGGLVLGQLMSDLLFDIGGSDPVTLLSVVVTMLGAAGLAVYVPARRASRVDPAVALRND